MRSVLLLAVIAMSGTARADEKIVNRTRDTGKIQVVSVGNCDILPREVIDFAGQRLLQSDFSITSCKETVTYKVKVVTDDKWYTWDSEETVIPGSEVYSYSLHTTEKVSSEPLIVDDILQSFRVSQACNNLREAYAGQVIPLAQTGCVQQ